MTAIRVITDHEELDGSGQVSHEQLDTYITGSAFLVVSGTGPLPPSGRRLVAGSGIVITDTGPGGTLTIAAPGAGAAISWNEIPSGSNDGVNKTFTLAPERVDVVHQRRQATTRPGQRGRLHLDRQPDQRELQVSQRL